MGFPWVSMAGVHLFHVQGALPALWSPTGLKPAQAWMDSNAPQDRWDSNSICHAPNASPSCASASLAILLELSNILRGQRPEEKKHPQLSTLETKLVVPTLAQIPLVKMPTKWAFGPA